MSPICTFKSNLAGQQYFVGTLIVASTADPLEIPNALFVSTLVSIRHVIIIIWLCTIMDNSLFHRRTMGLCM